jgi:uncharacterized protein YbjQ (UPF0145 family)
MPSKKDAFSEFMRHALVVTMKQGRYRATAEWETRHLALRRICAEARAAGANAVIGIETRIMPFRGVHEMLMLGTAGAGHHPRQGHLDQQR